MSINYEPTRRSNSRRFLGAVVVLLGVVLLLDSTNVLTVDGFEVFLAGALVVYGLVRLVTERASHVFWPTTFVLVGTGWLLVEFGALTGAQAGRFWPLLVVVLGLSLVLGRRRSRLLVGGEVVGVHDSVSGAVTGDRDVVAVFEDARVDLRGLAVETPLTIDAVAIFGDAEVVVPEDWVVVTETTAVFGALKDLRRTRPAGEPDLVVSGLALFGDVQVRD